MGLFKAVVKTAFEGINQCIFNHDVKNAKKKASKTTRTKVAISKQKGKTVNAKKIYCNTFYPALEKAQTRKNLRSTFIANI